MIDATYTGVLTLAAGAFLLAAVLIVWRREVRATINLLAWQGAALAAIPIANGIHQGAWVPIAVGVVVLVLRAFVLPFLLARAIRGDDAGARPRPSSTQLRRSSSRRRSRWWRTPPRGR